MSSSLSFNLQGQERVSYNERNWRVWKACVPPIELAQLLQSEFDIARFLCVECGAEKVHGRGDRLDGSVLQLRELRHGGRLSGLQERNGGSVGCRK